MSRHEPKSWEFTLINLAAFGACALVISGLALLLVAVAKLVL